MNIPFMELNSKNKKYCMKYILHFEKKLNISSVFLYINDFL